MSSPISSHRNPRLVEAAKLRRGRARRETGRTLIEGPHLLAEAYGAEAKVEVVFALEGDSVTRGLADEHGSDLVMTDARGLKKVAGTESPRGPVAVVEIPKTAPVDTGALVVSWGVSDPGNVGTLIRTATGFGWGFGFTAGTADPWSPKVLRTGAGAQFRARMSPFESLDAVRLAGFEPIATVAHGGIDPEKVAVERPAVLVGEEAPGLPGDVIAGADHVVTVPMPGGTESLNAAVAAGIVMYAISRRGK